MTLVFWTGFWIALPLASMMLGNLWALVSPWTGPVRIARALMWREGGIGLARFGHWPAVLGLAGFAWFQSISLYPDDPAVLAKAALVYWAMIFVLAVLDGEDFLQRGEFLTVLFTMISRVSPVGIERPDDIARLCAGFPGAQVLRMAPLSPSATGMAARAAPPR